ncbi:non-ribosomal peptide synthase/polyketide synthase [Robbsia sp. KACC 23696]|uniref:non-ribosomal peptide synthase/polyketide synthase n=1 Tax=Robbsia sp. KACC 23696 TaxID=3149231 RepID=UPI00325BF882
MSNRASESLAISAAYAALPEEKRRIFRQRLWDKGMSGQQLPILPFAARGTDFPLSYAQERLWFLWCLEPDAPGYNLASAVRLLGVLDPGLVQGALQALGADHEILKARFIERDGVPRQTIGQDAYSWHENDLRAIPSAERESVLHERLAALSRAPFDLAHGPLLRVTLLRLSAQAHVLHFATHHIVSDAWSLDVLTQGFARHYIRLQSGTTAASAVPAVQYVDYAAWQREWLDVARLDTQLAYWRTRLGTEHPVLDLPVARKRTGLRRSEGGRLIRTLSTPLTQALRTLSRGQGATLFMTLLATYNVLLARYSRQQDIRIGVPVAGRDRPEVERLIGFFVNTLVIRAELEGVRRFDELLAQVRERMVEAQEHQDVPFARLVEALQPQRSLSHTPLFQAMFNYAAAGPGDATLPGLTIEPISAGTETARFDLVLNVVESDTLSVSLTYARDLFDEAVVQRMLDHYVELLEQIGAQPDIALGQLRLGVDQRFQHEPPRRAYEPAVRRFAAQARREPLAPALHCEGVRLNYGQLDAWSTAIAQRLLQHGARADVRIGICMTRSVGLVAALLGVMKSGAAFVPLDPEYPEDRLAYMIEDAGVGCVLADAETAQARQTLLQGREVIVVEEAAVATSSSAPATAPIEVPIHPEQLAYVIYTSGSTGRPKGVAISQRALALHLADFLETYGISAQDKQLQSSTINFDVSLHEMLPALMCGGQVEMRGAQPWDLETMSRHLAEEGVTFSRIPTAYWQQWLREPPAASRLAALRQITVGGEGLPGDALRQWREGPLAHIQLDNLYGPTETTVACMYRRTTAEDVTQAIVSIGKPYASRNVYVLDASGNEVPLGGLGELCIGGETLARGYLGRPGLSAQQFIPNPFGAAGSRLYRSGDLCRRREDGTIDFLGRIDQQVKLRGFRIELGEIESVLRQVPGVGQAAVELRGEGEGRRLVGYVSGAAGAGAIDVAALRAGLEGKLPAYMVPSAFVVLERLPVMQNGKVDRRALPEPEAGASREPVAARTPAETRLLTIWRAVLGRDDIGVTDNFFEAGGDSILSLQIIARAKDVGLKLTPRQVFEHPTVVSLAAIADVQDGESVGFAEIHDALPLTPIQQSFFERFPLGESHWNQAVLLNVEGQLDRTILRSALSALSENFDALRLRFQRDAEGRWHQRVAPQETQPVLEYIDLRDRSEGSDALLQHATRLQKSLHLEQGPLFRVGYFEMQQTSRLLLIAHHLVVDGVSWRILLETLQSTYEALATGDTVAQEASMPWGNWVAEQDAWARSGALETDLAWWREALTAARADLPLAPIAAPATWAATAIEIELDREATDALLRGAPRAWRAGVEDVLLAALTQAVAAWSETPGLLVSLEAHGRALPDHDAIDVSRTVGWFTTQFPVWLSAHADPAQAICEAKETLRRFRPHGIGYGWLRHRLDTLPSPRIGFNYLGQFDQSLDTGGRFSFASESSGPALAANEPADMALDLNAMIVEGRLSISWKYREGELHHDVVTALARDFETRLHALIAHCRVAESGATASDFPLAQLAQPEYALLAPDLTRVSDIYAASPVQQGVVFHAVQDGPRSGVYVNQKRWTVRGNVDHGRMQNAWNAALARHESLATAFEWKHGGQIVQLVYRDVRVPYDVHDWYGKGERYEDALTEWMVADVARGFDLTQPPLMRFNVFRRPDGHHDLVWTDHHVLLDGWSVSQLLGEVLAEYEGAAVPVHAGRYRDYIAWLARRDAKVDAAYWRERLTHVEAPTLLSGALPYGQQQAASGQDEHRLALGVPLTQRLVALARSTQVTLNTVVQGAWALLLQRYTGQGTVVFGTTVSGRPADLAGAQQLLGLFINTLPVVLTPRADQTVADWLGEVQAQGLAMREHEHTPLSEVHRWAGVGGHGLFDTLLVYENYPVDAALKEAAPAGLAFEMRLAREQTNYPLSIIATLSEQMVLQYRYERASFTDHAIAALAAAMTQVLGALCDDADGTLGNVSLQDDQHSRRWLALGTGAETVVDAMPLHDRIAEMARSHPDRIALMYGETTLRYDALDAAANRLAHRLVKRGVGAEVRVGIAVERSIEMVVGLLAILKAGGAYVPMDPEYPRERLAYMLEDSGVALLLTQSWLRADLPVPEGLPILELDKVDVREEPSTAPPIRVRGENLAYVIYTSGSTGRPKGAANHHDALSNRLAWMQSAYALDERDCVLQKTPFSFDVSVWEFFWPLMTGATLAIAEPGAHRDPQRLVDAINTHGVTTLHFVPSMLQAFVAHEGVDTCTSLKRIVCSGEALPADLANRTLALLPRASVYNLYGPTEAAIDVTHWTCEAGAQSVPIGRPIANVRTYVLDGAMNLAPHGAAGELYLGGVQLARGYLKRAGLSAERFVPDPFDAGGARLYRTGDLVRWNDAGALDYLGRIDHQVKIRGFRIELGEVEAQLLAQGEVAETVVTAQEGAGGTRLVAYVTAKPDVTIDVGTLREALGRQLPDHMVPSVIVVLAALPLSPNGKVDRKALPSPEYAGRRYDAPRGAVEQALAQIWQDVLGVARVGRDDNFFELGGDSILSLQIVARARRAGWQFSARQLFEQQTVAALGVGARHVDLAEPMVDDAVGDVPLLPVQRMFFEQAIPNRHHWNQAVLLEAPAHLDSAALTRALQALIDRHGALRLQFQQGDEGQWRQTYAPLTPASLDLWTRDVADASAIEALCDAAQRSLNIETGPLLRAVSMRVADGSARLLLVIHHLAIDGVSWRVLLEDLQHAYTQFCSGRSPEWPRRGASFGRWSKALVAHAATCERERDYWRDILRTPAEIPVDDPDGSQTLDNAASVAVSLTREQTRALLHEAPAAYRTQVNDLLLTALGRALCTWSGRDSIRIDLEGHGREEIEDGLDVSATLGWFTTIYPITLKPSGALDDAIRAVKESLRAIPGRGLGFGLLRYAGEPDTQRQLAAAAPSQVLFNYLGQFDAGFDGASTWRPAQESSGVTVDTGAVASHALSVNGRVYDGRLDFTIRFSGARHRQESIDALAGRLQTELAHVIAHCTGGARGVTPSDFPLVTLNQVELDALGLPAAQLDDLYPLTPMQSGMLFHTLYAPQDSAYVSQLRVAVDGLDVTRFHAAWAAVVAREAVLRTAFVQHGDGWLQWVSNAAEIPFVALDWRDVPQPEAALEALAQAEQAKGFDVTRSPLMRLTLVRTGVQRHTLIWTHHHALLDGWSVSQLLGDVLSHYAGAGLSSQRGRYRDYIDWLQRRDAKADEAFWREQLRPLDGATLLSGALSYASPAAASGYGEYRLQLDAALTRQLTEWARAQRVTVSTVIQGAWALLLQRYTGQEAVAFGATVSGRPEALAGAQQLLGLFINTLPVVVAPRSDRAPGEWLRDVQAQGLSMREHEHTPLNEIQRWAGSNGQALFDTLVVYENYPVDAALKQAAPGGLTFGEIANREETNYPLTLAILQRETLGMRFGFAHASFSKDAVERIAEQLRNVLSAFASARVARLGDVVLPVAEEVTALLRLNPDLQPYKDRTTVHDRIAEMAQAYPDRIALMYGETTLRYDALDAAANRLAHRLVKRGVGAEVRVGIAVERSIEMVVGLLAILKAGGAYVPMDPEYPRERLAYMLEDSGVALLLTQSWLRADLPVPDGLPILELDKVDVREEPSTALPIRVRGENLAYVIYTSGSTGRPKGAANHHDALSNRLAWMQSAYGLDERDCVLQKTPFSFDVSVWEFFWPLMTGATLAIAEPGAHRDPQRLVDAINTHGVTTLHFVPSMLQAFVAHEGVDTCTSLKRIVCSGEALPADLANRTLALLPRASVYNLYGPTEAAIDVTHWTCEAGAQSVPIGRPIANVRTYVLDGAMNLAPHGAAGELYLGGVQLARGYLKRAGLSAERFVPDPFDAGGARLYRTGDLVRWNDAGALDYLGRIDHQVKIRGFRIELGEVEAQLLAQGEVAETVVTAQEGAGGTRLVAYVTAKPDVTIDVGTLREALGRQLPDHMVPSVIVVLAALPLSPNGKVDRKALPSPEYAGRRYDAPRGAVEQALAQIWQDVLGVARVGRDDNFFELGGDSILAIRLVSRIRKACRRELPLQAVFAQPALHELAAIMAATVEDGSERGVFDGPVRRIGDHARAPLSHAQERLWFLWRLDPSSAAYNTTGATRLHGAIDSSNVRRAFAIIHARHQILQTRFEEGVDGVSQIVSNDRFDWHEHDLSSLALSERETSLAALLSTLSRAPFDLERGPLLRVSLVRMSDEEHVLHFAMHHIVSDAWSLGILTREFVRNYASLQDGVIGALPPLPVQYGDFAAWQRERLDPARLDAQLAYWREQLGTEHPILELPVSRKRTGLRTADGGRVTRDLTVQQSQALRQVSRARGATMFMTLLAAYNVLLSRYSGQQDIRVGVPAAGRDRAEIEALIGFFVNTLVIRTDLTDLRDFGALLAYVREQVVAAQAHQDVPFARLVEVLQPQRSLSHTPLFQAMFNHVVAERAALTLPGLTVSSISAGTETARFDLVLNVVESDTLSVSLTYARDLFDEAVVQRMLDHYVELLEQIGAQPDIALGQLRLGVDQRFQHEPPRRAYEPAVRRFAAQARREPLAPALHCEGVRLNYGQLDAWSTAIAQRLLQHGARADVRIGICMTRSVGLVAALLGVMKSGAAFVPLDPEYPEDRLAYMIEDAGVGCVLADAETAQARQTLLQGREVIVVEEAAVATSSSAPATAPFEVPIHPEQLAYVIYTSGSTGRPKGVAISQRALALHLADFLETYGISAQDKQLQSSTINFDVSLHEMLPALMCGGQVEMRGAQPWDLETMSRHLAEEGVTFSRIPTAYWQQWLREPPAASRLAALRQITVGGEGLPGDALRQWREGPLTHIQLDNLYGPTETTVACMYRRTTAEDVTQAIVSIGKPYASRNVYVLDASGNEVPLGGLGELCIGGETLARGYLGRPGLSAQQFIPNPFGAAGSRLYRSGDLCRRREDGTIDFLGRIDQQVKLRGFRIELGEIESVLRQVPGVGQAAVELRGEGEGRRLVGYVSGAAGAGAIDVAALRAGLEGKLPAYMVPSAFVVLERLPVMQNGKVDRRALPEPEAGASREPVAARTPAETRLLTIWRAVLGRDDIGVTDNFFEAGGDSLRALKLVQYARAEGFDALQLEQLFTHPTIRSLIEAMTASRDLPANIIRMTSGEASINLFAIHPLYGLVAEYRTFAMALEGSATVYGIQAPYYTDKTWWPETLPDLAADYVARIRQVQPDGPYHLLGWSLGGVLAAEVAHLLEQDGQAVHFLGLLDSAAPHEIVEARDGAIAARAILPRRLSDDELEGFRKFLLEAQKWTDFLPEGDALELLRTAALMNEYFTSIVRQGQRKSLQVPLTHWWARRIAFEGTPLVSERQSDWSHYIDGAVRLSAFVDADHMGLPHHADFVRELRTLLSSLNSKVSHAA